jgi:hypothetical protein
METLKLKIFEVLVEKITILEFENWLYNSEFLKEELKSNSLIFSLVNLNYRKSDIIKRLEEISSEIFNEDDRLIIKIQSGCRNIVKANNSKEIEDNVLRIIENFDFDDDFQVLWGFYDLYHSFEGYCENYLKSSFETIDEETKQLAEETLELMENCKSIEDKINILSLKKEVVKTEKKESFIIVENEKLTFLNKILAYFKKI